MTRAVPADLRERPLSSPAGKDWSAGRGSLESFNEVLYEGGCLRPTIARIPFAVVIGTITFWVGFARLVLMSARLMADVARGHHPHAALAHMQERRAKRGHRF